MRRLLRWLVGLPLAIVAIAFAVANRQWITVSLDPVSSVPLASVTMPLWALFFAGVLPGLFIGWIACWFAQGKWRRNAREARRELARQPVAPASQSGGRDIAPMTELQP
jgi:uncharacterized integral membrane protein